MSMNLRNGKNVRRGQRDSTPELLLEIQKYEDTVRDVQPEAEQEEPPVAVEMADGDERRAEVGARRLVTTEDLERAEEYAHHTVAIVTLFAEDLAHEAQLPLSRVMAIIGRLRGHLRDYYIEQVEKARRDAEDEQVEVVELCMPNPTD